MSLSVARLYTRLSCSCLCSRLLLTGSCFGETGTLVDWYSGSGDFGLTGTESSSEKVFK